MFAQDAVLLIDTQLYVDLYRIESGKDLLAPLQQLRDHIFITEQIVNEVNKHKLQEAKKFFQEKCQIGRPPGCMLPDHLFDDDGTIVQKIREKLSVASARVKEATRDLETAIAETLRLISRSEDVVSKALTSLFANAIAHQPEQLARARVRKERGFPPGKIQDGIGDQLNWEQFLSFVRETGKTRLWIISRDSDYCLTRGKEAVFLVPTLYQELMSLGPPSTQVFAFTTIGEGIKDFCDVTGFNADMLPPPEILKKIKREQEELPPLGWVSGSPSLGLSGGSQSDYARSSYTPHVPEFGSGSGSGSGYHSEYPSGSGFGSGSGQPWTPAVYHDSSDLLATETTLVINGEGFTTPATTNHVTLEDSSGTHIPCKVINGDYCSLTLTIIHPPIPKAGALTASVTNDCGTSSPTIQVATVTPLWLHWDDETKSEMRFENGAWIAPSSRKTASGQIVPLPSIQITEQGVIVDGVCYPVENRVPFFADFDHSGLRI